MKFNETLTSANRSKWESPTFWLSLCPELSIGKDFLVQPEEIAINADEYSRKRKLLAKRGFATVDEKIHDKSLIEKLRKGIECLRKHDLPASFILLFDETWELAIASRTVLKRTTLESNAFHFDILAWCIDSGGFTPHRDRQPEDVATTFCNGDAKFVTQWIALSDATPENSCLYMIPKDCDPGYEDGDIDEEDPLRRALPDKHAYQNIRALPRLPGESILFTHRVIHWGSSRDEDSTAPPRMALSFVCCDPSFEKPYVDPKYFSDDNSPPFHIRLLLVCAQLLIYYQRFGLSRETIKVCYEYCKLHEGDLELSYRQKVSVEFVKAMKESSTKGTATANGQDKPGTEKTEQADEDEDLVLEEILEAEEGGYGEFEDDFDELEGDDCNDHDELRDEDDWEENEFEGMELFREKRFTSSNENEAPKRRKT